MPRVGAGVTVDVSPTGAGQVVERWELSDGAEVQRTVVRTVPATPLGRASFLMPSESGQPGVVYGYALTGAEGPETGYAMAQLVTAPGLATGGAGSSRGTLSDPTSRKAVGSVFRSDLGSADPEQVIGIIWSRTAADHHRDTRRRLARRRRRPAKRAGGRRGRGRGHRERTDVGPAVARRRAFRLRSASGPLALKDAGSLQVGVEPHSVAAPGTEHDLAVGWVTAGPIALTSTDPADAFTVAYGQPVGGRTPFVARSTQSEVKGTVTVTGGGENAEGRVVGVP